jgi:glycine/D-amino acid oxidase-like deaminating enzyme
MRARIVIIGGGVMGVSIAWHAARRTDAIEEPVVLLEKRALGAGSSGRSGAILRQHYSEPIVAGMARDSLREYAQFHARTGRSIGFERCGVLTIAGPSRPEEKALVERNIAMQRSIGIDTRRIDAAEIRALVPGIEIADGTIAAYEPGGGYVDPASTLEAFAAVARDAGAITRIGISAKRLVIESGRVVAVETDEGTLHGSQVVVAAGPWTRRFLLGAGVDLPLTAVRPEQHFVGSLPTAEARSAAADASALAPRSAGAHASFASASLGRAAHPVLLDLEEGFYSRCEPAQARTRVGKMDYHGARPVEDPDAFDEHVDPAFGRWARSVLCRRMPRYASEPDVGAQAAMYTLTPDAQALIGPVRGIDGLFVVSGFSGHGFKLAPSIGEGVAQMLFGEPITAFDAAFFDPYRFERDPARSASKAFGF